jgi:hypothetical protein
MISLECNAENYQLKQSITPRITGANVVNVSVHEVVRLSSVALSACLERHAYHAGSVGDARTPLWLKVRAVSDKTRQARSFPLCFRLIVAC